jgi:hypothetical protein
MYRDVPPIHLYLLSCLIFVAGGGIFAITGWESVMWLCYLAGIASIIHLVVDGVAEKIRQIWMETTTYYETVAKFDPETRYQLGLTAVAHEVSVKIDKTALAENEMSLSWRKLPIQPYKMKIIAQACLHGTPFTIRQWAGPEKILSDPEWRELKDALLNLNFLAQKNPKNVNDGFEWTELGVQMLEQCVASPLT